MTLTTSRSWTGTTTASPAKASESDMSRQFDNAMDTISGNPVVWPLVIGVVGLMALWPYFLGTWLAVEFGAGNPSTARTVVGWVFEAPWAIILFVAVVCWLAESPERPQRQPELPASGAIYETRVARSIVYRHGNCTVNHRSPETAARCSR